MLKKLAYLTLITLFISCKSDDGVPDCSAVTCTVSSITINLIDDASDENFIIKNSISKENIELRDASNSLTAFSLNDTNGLIFVQKNEMKKGSLELTINSEVITSFSYDTPLPNANECCAPEKLIDVELTNDKSFNLEVNTITIYL